MVKQLFPQPLQRVLRHLQHDARLHIGSGNAD